MPLLLVGGLLLASIPLDAEEDSELEEMEAQAKREQESLEEEEEAEQRRKKRMRDSSDVELAGINSRLPPPPEERVFDNHFDDDPDPRSNR